MNPSSPAEPSIRPPEPSAHAGIPLPDLQNALLDAATVEQLFRDIAACAEVIEVLPKFSDRSYAQTQVTLAEAQALLQSQQVRAVQIRYRYDGKEWWDTLLRLNKHFRLVRMEQTFGTHAVHY